MLACDSMANFLSGTGVPVAKDGKKVNPLNSCFKIYNFLSNVAKEN